MDYKSVVIAAITVVLCGCNAKEANNRAVESEAHEELPKVEIGIAESQDVPQTQSYTANVEADNTNNISPATPNRIQSISVDAGDRVRKGQTLVILDRANSDQLKINRDQVKREYDRAVQLLEIGAGTQQSVDQLKAQLDAAESQLKNMLENTELTSPINGIVTARNYDPGDMTGALPILTVGQLSPNVKVLINITENDFSKVKIGMPVEVQFDAFEGELFNGKVSRIYPTVDPATRTFRTEILINNSNERILPGMFARVSIDPGSQKHVVVPDRAVVKQSGSGNKYVYVYHQGIVNYNKVELGRRLGDSYELLGGVADGDTVVISGQSRLADGVAVEILGK